MPNDSKVVLVAMGSQSDWPTMKETCKILAEFGVGYDARIISVHRTPDRALTLARKAEKQGFKVIIAGAGGAAHLPGFFAAWTVLPVIGVPIKTPALGGVDSLYSILQMPTGVPVATMAIDGAKNAAIFALEILAVGDPVLQGKLHQYRIEMATNVAEHPIGEPAKP